MFQTIFECIGIFWCLYASIKVLKIARHALKVYMLPTYPDFSKYGKWSVITGATGGIGKAVAYRLAESGQNIILLGRNTTKLTQIAKDIKFKHKVEVKYLDVDFSHDDEIYHNIEDFLKNYDIGVLVNNVGIRSCPVEFLDVPNLSKLIPSIFRINMLSCCKMHQIVLPGMVKRKRGLIINISSAAGFVPTVRFALYGATKAFVDHFSQSLSYEYVDKGITIQSCIPFWVSTGMTENMEENILVKSPESYASSLLATVGKERRTHGCWQHALEAWVCRNIPLTWVHRLLREDISTLLNRMEKNKRPDSLSFKDTRLGKQSDKTSDIEGIKEINKKLH